MRQERLEAGLERLGAAALLVTAESSRDPDLAAFVGSVHLGQCFVLAVPGCAPILGALVDMERDEAAATGLELAPVSEIVLEKRRRGAKESDIWVATLAAVLENSGLESSTLAVGGSGPTGRTQAVLKALTEQGMEFVDGQSLMRSVRKPKSENEQQAVRRAAEGACSAFRRAAKILANVETRGSTLHRNGGTLTAGDLRREIARILSEHGLEQPEGNIVATGAESGVPHTQGANSKILRSGESIVIDLYPKGELFADCTRTFCVGTPPEILLTAHRLCSEALADTLEKAIPGVLGADLHGSVCRFFEGEGFATIRSSPGTTIGYVHGLGHGVGYELHEFPSFRSNAEGAGVLEPSDVFTLEPGLYDPDVGYGVRLEDLFVMGEVGPENLTPLPYHLDPRAW